MALLIVERGHAAGRRLPLTKFPITIGRDPTNDVVIDDEEASRFHVRIKRRGRLFICEDLESKNGTFINGDRILNATLRNGDKLLIGATEFQFAASEPDIQLAGELLDFEFAKGEELGLKGPLELGKGDFDKKHTPIRLNQLSVINQLTSDAKAIKEIYELHSNILVIDDLEEASKTLLKSLGKLMPSASRAALFVWAAASRQLIPFASRQFKRRKEIFFLSQRALEDVLTRKQGVLLLPDEEGEQALPRTRLILPMIHGGEPICLIHVEADHAGSFSPRELEFSQALISRCAPSFETMLLRRELDAWMVGMIETMIATIEAKDTYTHGHSERVSRYSMAIAEELKLNREIKRLLLVSALCHDIGKIGIPDAILKKASMLSAEEYEEMKLHPTIGANIISHMPNAHRFISGVKYHHEKWDGTGYPEGLEGEEIPFFGRIIAIADAFDAMVSGRSYSGFIGQGDAMQRLVDEKDLFDPEILKACVRAHDSGRLTLKTSTANNRIQPETDGAESDSPANREKALRTTASNFDTQKPSRLHPKGNRQVRAKRSS